MAVNDEAGLSAIWPVILCGGSGSRLWPLSRSQHSKPLLTLGGERSLLIDTVERIRVKGGRPPVVVGSEDQRFLIADQLAEHSVSPAAQWLEPEGRNTAAAVALAALGLIAVDPDAVMLVMPADHVISDCNAFRQAVATGLPAGHAGRLVTLGIRPTRAETGYGYIEGEEGGDSAVQNVRSFVEKPDLARAEAFVAGGRHFWNAGIFLMRADAFLAELEQHAPAIASACRTAAEQATIDGLFTRPGPTFLESPATSIDYAVMERTARASVVPVSDLGWTDVGNWHAVWEIAERDAAGNARLGKVHAVDCSGSLLHSVDGATVAALGLEDMVVVATRDAVLVCPRDRAQDLRMLVAELERSDDGDLVRVPAIVHRPWGTYQTTDRGDRFQTKRIVVKPREKLSLQMHHHRSEHWIVVRGTAEVTVGDSVRLIRENESTYIPAGTLHRLANPGKIPLELIEVQCGPYLGEDDIVRFEDDYGRF